MNKHISSHDPIRARNHLANERTFLAWIRTSIGIIALGFVVEKFTVFMNQMAYFFGREGVPPTALAARLNYSSFIGISLVVLGTVIGLFSYLKYKKTGKEIEEGNYESSFALAWILTAVVVLIGCFLAIYLMLS